MKNQFLLKILATQKLWTKFYNKFAFLHQVLSDEKVWIKFWTKLQFCLRFCLKFFLGKNLNTMSKFVYNFVGEKSLEKYDNFL
jgi:hypothetical protein